MKSKTLYRLIPLFLAFSLLFGLSFTAWDSYTYGDVNQDGSIGVSDARLLLRHIIGLEQLNDTQLQAANVSGSEGVDVGDAILILRRTASLIHRFPVEDRPDQELEVHFIDVGQGDSILIRTPEEKVILIDAGVRSAGQVVVDYLAAAGITSIDIIVGTHPHADHIGGLIQVMEELPVGKVIDSGKVHNTLTYQDYLAVIEEKKIPFFEGRAGQEIELDSHVNIKILHPGSDLDSYCLNNASIVIKLLYGTVGFLFTGDAEKEAEKEILERDYDLSLVNILKVGHHGSRTSTSPSFLDALSPEAAVIFAGQDNPYGHPHSEVIDRLTDAAADVYRTDIHGTIVVTTCGYLYRIETIHEESRRP